MSSLTKENLSNVADVKLSNVDKKTIETEMPILLCNYTDVYKNSYINKDKSEKFMQASCNENEYDKFILKSGQVAITKDSEKANDIGIPTYIDDDLDNVVLGYHLSLITPNRDKLDGKYLRYWLDTKQSKKYFENNALGSGQRLFLTLDGIKSIPLHLPALNTQKNIANILFNLDKKIELNNKINKELESIVKTLYDYWFVQFDFPNQNGKPYKSSGGAMEYNKKLKREIPKGWGLENIANSKLTSIINPGIESYDGKKIYLSTSEVENNDITNHSILEEYNNRPSRANMQPEYNSIWFARMKDTKKVILLGDYSDDIVENYIFSTGFAGLRINQIALFYTWNYIHNDWFEEVKNINATGSTQKAIINEAISNIPLVIPSDTILKMYYDKVYSIYKKIYINQRENLELANLRDWLLPMLMNGQVSVK